ncbi:c-type cytochrome [Acetobacter lambici]|uniref:C-type cytochrome n=2 Tax=Acetobacter lambici TaxID=1332824 RepID=A0ABT1EVQ4_9PROT|nr:c-type cytochrome [Acetobacter lambici]MCP1241293.1 c-type cytochrome [Acetobacter lambici]MCP1257037.1 c-type cytochrome [Acetobacter lambici]
MQTQPVINRAEMRMDGRFLNRVAVSVLLSVVAMGGALVIARSVVPDTAPVTPVFRLPSLQAVAIAPYMQHASVVHGGQLVGHICAQCHGLVVGGESAGPVLADVVGRSIASLPGYAYSTALRQHAGQVWDDQRLSDWLMSPARYVVGTRMSFAGLSDPQDRADAISYLHTLHTPTPITGASR